jgi:hypothetical protein
VAVGTSRAVQWPGSSRTRANQRSGLISNGEFNYELREGLFKV